MFSPQEPFQELGYVFLQQDVKALFFSTAGTFLRNAGTSGTFVPQEPARDLRNLVV